MNTPPRRKSELHQKVVDLIRQAYPNFTVYEEHPMKVQLAGRKSTVFVDILVKELSVAIECHGRQHSSFVPHFHETRQKFADAKERDITKAAALQDAGYTFVVVQFNEEKSLTIETLLTKIQTAISENS